MSSDLRDYAIALVQAHYADFGPTLACEKLRDLHDVTVSVETLRSWMTVAGLWTTRSEQRRRPQPPRARTRLPRRTRADRWLRPRLVRKPLTDDLGALQRERS